MPACCFARSPSPSCPFSLFSMHRQQRRGNRVFATHSRGARVQGEWHVHGASLTTSWDRGPGCVLTRRCHYRVPPHACCTLVPPPARDYRNLSATFWLRTRFRCLCTSLRRCARIVALSDRLQRLSTVYARFIVIVFSSYFAFLCFLLSDSVPYLDLQDRYKVLFYLAIFFDRIFHFNFLDVKSACETD